MGKLGYTKKGKAAKTGFLLVSAAGTAESLHPSITATTIAFVDSDPDTITDSGSGFLNKGFQAGQIITVSGSVANDGNYTIATVAAGTITLIAGDELTAGIATPSVTITVKDRIAVRDVTCQSLGGNTSAHVAMAKSTAVTYSTEFGMMVSKYNTASWNMCYLDEIYIDVGTNDDGVFYEYTPVL